MSRESTDTAPWSPSAFEARYRAEQDPWDFAGSAYEQARYDEIMASLDRPFYERAYEPGCSVGVLTERLGPRCRHLDAVDVSPTAVAHAAARCGALPSVHVSVGSVADAPPADLDLVVFSEIGYYFPIAELDRIVEQLSAALRSGGTLVACHWLGHSDDHQLHGSVVHERLRALTAGRYARERHLEAPGFVVDAWRRS